MRHHNFWLIGGMVILALLMFMSVSSAWWNTSWSYKVECQVNTTVSSSLTDYPAYCILDTDALTTSKLQADCDDIRVLNSDEDTVLDYEVENCDATNTVLWFRLPTTTADGNDTVYLYYGNPSAPNAEDIAGVWSNMYSAVWHFDQDYTDSANNLDWTAISTPLYVSGAKSEFGYGTELFTNDTGLAYISSATGVFNVSNYSLSVWGYSDTWAVDTNERFHLHWHGGGSEGIYARVDSSGATKSYHYGLTPAGYHTANTTISTGTRYVAVYQYDGENAIEHYLDGVKTADVSATGNITASTCARLGAEWEADVACNSGLNTGRYDGVLSEIRISNISRSDDWIAADYGQTYSLGSEESSSSVEDITACRDLNVSGTTYNLTQNVTTTDDCFTFSADEITLECNGFWIDGDDSGASDEGIRVAENDNIIIQNCNVKDFAYGISVVSGSNNTQVINTTSTSNTINGFYAATSGAHLNNISFSNVTASFNDDDGMNLQGGSTGLNRTVDSALVFSNGATGIDARQPWEVSSSESYNNTNDGMYVRDTSDVNVTDTLFYDNGDYGLYVSQSDDVLVQDCRFYNNGDTAFHVDQNAANDLTLTNLIFDRDAGDLTDYTNLSITDTMANGEEYTIDHADLPSTPPNDKDDLGMWTNFTIIGGTPSLDTVIWHYLDSDIVNMGEGSLDMYKWNGSWTELTDTLDTGANTLTVNNLASFSDFGPLGDPDFKVNITIADTNETENETVYISLISTVGDITEYNLTFTYNNTAIEVWNVTGISEATIDLNTSVIAPLVASNLTNIAWEAVANVTIGGSDYGDTDSGNQQVHLWYYIGNYPVTADASYTVEERNNYTVTIPDAPDDSPEDVTYDFLYALDYCTWLYANGTGINETCENTLVQDFMANFSSLPSHTQEDGIIYSDIFLNRSYTITFDATAESNSTKTITETWNASREYFVWITEADNGTIDGAENISTWLNVSFYLEADLSATTASSVVSSYTIEFPDGYTKNYTVSYAGTLSNATVRGYPDFYLPTISSVEVYSKSGYTTRSRFMLDAETDMTVQQNASIYFLVDANSTYGLIIVHDNGDPVTGAYIHIQKYFADESLYITVDERVTNADGRAASYLDMDAYYHFIVYDGSDASVLYTSTAPEQFIIEDSVYTVTINIADANPIDLISPYENGYCYGNNATNTIVFTYADGHGLAESINFLAYRENVSAPVCNQTITGSSGGYTCSLSSPENLTAYLYSCEVHRSASPSQLVYTGLIDFRTFSVNTDWIIVALTMVVVSAGALFSMSIGIALAGVSLFALSALEIIQVSEAVSIPVMAVSLVLAFLLSKRD